jgi:hypothetical protein
MSVDCGEVIAGEVVTRVLSIPNTTDTHLVFEDGAVRVGCGCVSIRPERRELARGEKASVAVAVDTTGRAGPMAYGGAITLTDGEGRQHSVSLTLKGVILPALVAEPAALVFTPAQVAYGAEQEVYVRAALDVDWESLSFSGQPSHLHLRIHGAKGRSARIAVKYLLPAGIRGSVDTLTVNVQVAASSPRLAGKRVSLALAVRATADQRLTVTPGIVPLVSRADGKGSARLLMRGRDGCKLTVKAVAVEGCRVDWKLEPQDDGSSGILELSVSEGDGAPGDTLVIEVEGETPIRLPITRAGR